MLFSCIDPNRLGLPAQSMALFPALVGGTESVFSAKLWQIIWRFSMRGSAIALVVFIVIFEFGGVVYGSLGTSKNTSQAAKIVPSSNDAKVLVLGFDGLDPDILVAMMDAGKLPAFDNFRKAGGFGRLGTIMPPQSSVVWSSVATGLDPGGHRVFDFVWRDRFDYSLDLNTTVMKGDGYVNRRKGQTVWSKLSENKIPVTVLFCPYGFPPEPVSGNFISGVGTPDVQGTLGRYTLISSDPKWAEKQLQGQLIGVAFSRDNLTFSLAGPRINSGGKVLNLTEKVDLRILDSEAGVLLKVNKQKMKLLDGQWSQWVRLKFRAGSDRKIHAICRFYVSSTKPELNLYCTAIQFDPLKPAFAISYPADFAKELADNVGLFATLGMPFDTKALEDGVIGASAFLQMVESVTSERKKILSYVLDEWEKGFVFCSFASPDAVQHVFWQDLLKRRLAEQGVDSLPESIIRIYQRMDQIVAEIITRIEDEPRTQMVILSGHGFDDFRRTVHMNRVLAEIGYLKLKEGMDESKAQFKDVDWTRTKAYACGLSGIYLNMKGREGQGIVDTKEKKVLLSALKSKLLAYTDPNTSEHPFKEIALASEIYHGQFFDQGPDMLVGCWPGWRFSWQTALGAVPSVAIKANNAKWRGDHVFAASSVPGVLLVRNRFFDLPKDITQISGYLLSHFHCDGDG